MKEMNLIDLKQADYLKSIGTALIPADSRRDYRPIATAHRTSIALLLQGAAKQNLIGASTDVLCAAAAIKGWRIAGKILTINSYLSTLNH
jgi:hypothetical protein